MKDQSWAVIKQVFDSLQIEESGISFNEAVTTCSNLVQDSHGGSAWVVPASDAAILNGKGTDEYIFTAYGVDGKPFKVDI